MQKPMKGVSCSTRKGVEYWYAWVNGRKVYCGKGEKGHKMAKAAKAKEIAKGYESRELKAGLKVKRYEITKFSELHKWYMTIPEIQEQKAYGDKISHVAHLTEYFGNRPLNGFEKDEQSRYRAWRKRQGVTDGTVDKEIITLSAMFHEAMKCKKIPPECMPGQFLRLDLYNPRRVVTDEEFEKVVAYTNNSFKDVLVCAYESAMRAGEIINLRARQVHLDVKHISGEILDYIDLGIFDTKTGARRMVPVSPELKEVLKRRLKDLKPDARVFTNSRGRPYPNSQTLSNSMRYACQQVGVPYGDKLFNDKGERIGVVLHSLRHTRTTKWVEEGWSDELIRRATGHKSLDSYRKYVNITDARPIMKLVKQSPNERRGSIVAGVGF